MAPSSAVENLKQLSERALNPHISRDQRIALLFHYLDTYCEEGGALVSWVGDHYSALHELIHAPDTKVSPSMITRLEATSTRLRNILGDTEWLDGKNTSKLPVKDPELPKSVVDFTNTQGQPFHPRIAVIAARLAALRLTLPSRFEAGFEDGSKRLSQDLKDLGIYDWGITELPEKINTDHQTSIFDCTSPGQPTTYGWIKSDTWHPSLQFPASNLFRQVDLWRRKQLKSA